MVVNYELMPGGLGAIHVYNYGCIYSPAGTLYFNVIDVQLVCPEL